MIDFRYHLVSIVAVFLSLAIGLVLGANALQDPIISTLQRTASDLHNSNAGLRDANAALKKQSDGEEQFAATLAPQILANRLKGQSVVFIQTPGGGDKINQGIQAMVKQAGGSVTGTVTVQNQFLQDDQEATLEALATQFKTQVTFPDNATTYDRAGAVLASALVTGEVSQAGTEDTSGILAAFTDGKFVTVSGQPGRRATLAVMIAPSVVDKSSTAKNDNAALLSLAGAFAGADKATVMAGPLTAAQDGGLIAALHDSGVSGKVSSVDNADSPTASSGQTVVVLTLESQLVTGKAGAYGLGAEASAYLPTPVPTTSPTKGT